MRRLRVRFTVRRLMVVVAVAGVGIWGVARAQRQWGYYALGWWDAECELWQGKASIYGGGGGTLMGDICHVDRDTGLPIRRLFGCVVYEGDFEREDGHNHHIAQYIRWHGLPKNTLKPWETELFNLKWYFDARSRIEAPKRLLAGGPAVGSPDGRNSLRPVAGVKVDGSPSDSLTVVIAAGSVVLGDWTVCFDDGDSDLLWGPEGSRIAVIRSVSKKSEVYKAFDLRTGFPLRYESWDEGKRRSDLIELDDPSPAPPDEDARAR